MNKDLFQNRYNVVRIIIVVFASVFVLRLAYLQLFEKKYDKIAFDNAIKEVEVYPTRGLVYDRHGELIVYNEAIYDIMVTPRLAKTADSPKICSLLKLTMEDYSTRMAKARQYSAHKASVFMKQVSLEDYQRFEESQYLFPGFDGQVRTIRKYPHNCAAVILGDVGEVDDNQIKNSNGYYKPGDYVGQSGLERYYEKELGGTQGKKFIYVDVHNREQGRFNDGKYDTAAIAGDNLYSTIDIKLQEYGEQLMANKKGSIIAIEPETGEILCMVSSPGYDPNLLCGAIRGENFKKLVFDSLKPLFNRATMATYSPGSTFKPLVGLISLNEGVQGEVYTVPCNGFYPFAGLSLKCSHHHPWATNIEYAMAQSCNPYFWQTFRNAIENPKYTRIQDSYGQWADYCRSFGLGSRLGVDLPSEARGNIPSINYYNKIYGEKGWHSATIISLGIGQGEILVTPLQLANFYAALGNHGWYIKPHLVKTFQKVHDKNEVKPDLKKIYAAIDTRWYVPVNDGLRQVVEAGTATESRIEGISLCGKTGTVQNSHGDHHSVFAGFAPKDNPKIAIAVVVENAGFGATFACPIASLMVERFINDTVADNRKAKEKKMMETNLLDKYALGKNMPITKGHH
ncbi:MAG: penicillin-binding protein 2 [Bacteroidetes bacterium]|nr:penicillin-binding protein 2 [Bacteroidota bacterium]